MSYSTSDASAERRRGRWIALGLFAIAALPVLGAFAAYFFWTPSDRINYGELLGELRVPDAPLRSPDGAQFTLPGLKGKWLLVQIGSGPCAEACVQKLFFMRQVRLMQGREAGRVERVWITVDGELPDAKLLEAYEGLRVGKGDASLLGAFPSPRDPREHLYLVDPLGNVVLRFPAEPDPKRVSRDLSRLLKVSHIG
jgi:cytochrome oxidase Cu insertion factor (SCO1/SenC/PrrC family)